jgi:hypothetical protein
MTKFLFAKAQGEGFLQVDKNEFKFVTAYRAFAKHNDFVWLDEYDASDFLVELRQRGVEFEVVQTTL